MSVPALDKSATDRVMTGILLASAAYLAFTLQDAAIKLLVVGFSVWQILLFRSVTILIACMAIGGRGVAREAAGSPILLPMLGRSFLILSAWLCYYTAARDLQLAELTTIYFAAPLIVTVLSVFMLDEKVPASRWAAVCLGFVGVFVACRPAGLGLSLPVLLVLAAAFLWGLSIVLLRRIALSERTIVQMILNNGFFLVIAGVPMLWLWKTPSASELAMLVLVGGIGGLAQFMLFSSMRHAPASVIAPFEYSALLWAFALGWLIWSDVPQPAVFVGAALIVAAGLLILWSERRGRA